MIFQIFWPQKLESDNDLEALPIHTHTIILPKDLHPNYINALLSFKSPRYAQL